MTDMTNLSYIEMLLFYWSLANTTVILGSLVWYHVTEKVRRATVVVPTLGDEYLKPSDVACLEEWVTERDMIESLGRIHTPRWEALNDRITKLDVTRRSLK